MDTFNRYNLQILNNYNKELLLDSFYIFTKYTNIINEYVQHFNNNITIPNINYYKYALKNGIFTLKHVFNILLVYTKNIEITLYHSRNAYLFYTEYIGQINNDTNNFLQLTAKDSTLFVFKKTIFDINKEYNIQYTLVNANNDYFKLEVIKHLINIYNDIICLYIKNKYTTIKILGESSLYDILTNLFLNIINRLYEMSIKYEKIIYIEKLQIIEHFFNTIKNNYDFTIVINIIYNFIKIIDKKSICIDNINIFLLSHSLNNISENMSEATLYNIIESNFN